MPDIRSYLFDLNPGLADLFIISLGIAFIVVLLAGIVVYFRRRVLFRATPALAKLAGTAGLMAIVIGGIGTLFFIAAFFGIPLLGARFWLVGLALVSLALLVYLVYYLFAQLPHAVRRYQEQALLQRYLPRATPRRKGRGKRRG
ncbi:MAG: hypothetical protein ACYC3S_07425 [Chloroflexota bacterium]